jgi:hypothetical protein
MMSKGFPALCRRLWVLGCKLLGWHEGGRVIGFEGGSVYAACKWCNREVIQDKQGTRF